MTCVEKIEELQAKLAIANKEIERLSGKTGFCAECEKQARLLGMSGSREAALMAKLDIAVKALKRIKAGSTATADLEEIAAQALAEIKK